MSSRPDPLGVLNAELDALKAQGLYRSLRALEGKALSHVTYDHSAVVNLSSNNYLGHTAHPTPRPSALVAVRDFGVGSGAVRTISGTMAMHQELERPRRPAVRPRPHGAGRQGTRRHLRP